jgi:hypothetical protein
MGSCCNGPGRWSPEYNKKWKPENNSGCSCGGKSLGCNNPSLALTDSPRWQWEQVHGKLVTNFTWENDDNGHIVMKITRTPCPKTSPQTSKRC